VISLWGDEHDFSAGHYQSPVGLIMRNRLGALRGTILVRVWGVPE
jgi:hypothetical protein